MSTKSTDIAVIPTRTALATVTDDAHELIVRPDSPLGEALALQGVVVSALGAQRAIAKAVTGLTSKLMTGAVVFSARQGNERAAHAVALLDAADDRAYERAARGRK